MSKHACRPGSLVARWWLHRREDDEPCEGETPGDETRPGHDRRHLIVLPHRVVEVGTLPEPAVEGFSVRRFVIIVTVIVRLRGTFTHPLLCCFFIEPLNGDRKRRMEEMRI